MFKHAERGYVNGRMRRLWLVLQDGSRVLCRVNFLNAPTYVQVLCADVTTVECEFHGVFLTWQCKVITAYFISFLCSLLCYEFLCCCTVVEVWLRG
jgi:hypothetical protein